ncbi:SRPBCC domain-containing protein [Pseudalkalibacillus decolorationis]|uniref:SRPBCC domain-containing protein n=1 Tax=Pseudalkalibacillus decolorationis TaxID=163879 RepID=UPI0021481A33|nr:SRPBCC domain-containing protein [Pseudalkalibacillus decolorationis]
MKRSIIWKLIKQNFSSLQIRVIVTFEEQYNKTVLTMRMIFKSEEELDKVVKEYGAIEGAKSTLDRLEELLVTF